MPPPSDDASAMLPPPSRKRRRQRPTQPPRRSPSLRSALAAALSALLLLRTTLLPSSSSPRTTASRLASFLPPFPLPTAAAEAKEIIATREWQLLAENDTLPAGLHVRMDLSTGEKWAKLPEDEAERDDALKAAIHDSDNWGEGVEKVDAVEMDAGGALRIVEAQATGDDGGDDAADGNNGNGGNENDDDGAAPPHRRDYEMMHRVLSRLPPDELAPHGGLPALPAANASAPQLTDAQRDLFEKRMEALWTSRQEALAAAQEGLADLPGILKERIATLEEYLGDATGRLRDVLEERRQRADGGASDSVEEEEGGVANNILSALRDLEFQLSDVDMARDFRTLGGWAPLVALLDEGAHRDAAAADDDAPAVVDEIRALAATTIGTAVGNLGEFRPWALEEVARTADGTGESALALLVMSFERELAQRSADMGGHTMATASWSDERRRARATYKLRAAYALGSLLRGNPAAQRHFVAAGGADVLVRDALGTLSAVRGPEPDATLTKLDHRFASKVLGLGEDVVADVALHQEAYLNDDEGAEGTDDAERGDERMTAGQLVAAFTTERWCDLALRMLAPPTNVIGGAAARGIQERALGAVRQLAPGCIERSAREGGETTPWGREEVRNVRSGWNREGSDDGLDAAYRRELLALADAVLEGLQ